MLDGASRKFQDADGKVRAIVTTDVYAKMLAHALSASPTETGGVLIGAYEDDAAIVRHATAPPRGSSSTPTSFTRGTRGLLRLFAEHWGRGEYYIGEWHAHPNAAPKPSPADFMSLEEIARDGLLQCGSPLLIILGKVRGEYAMSVHVRWCNGDIERLEARPVTHCRAIGESHL